MTSCPARGCGSPTRSPSRSRSSDRGSPTSSSAASSRRPELIGRFYVFHIMLIPALMVGLISAPPADPVAPEAHPVPGRPGDARRTSSAATSGRARRSARLGLLFLTAAVLAALGGLVQINPVWVYGPFVPYAVSSPAQPDWYLGWLEGSLRLGPNWEPTILGDHDPESVPARRSSCRRSSSAASRCGRSSRRASTTTTRSTTSSSTPWQAPVRLGDRCGVLTLFIVLTARRRQRRPRGLPPCRASRS